MVCNPLPPPIAPSYVFPRVTLLIRDDPTINTRHMMRLEYLNALVTHRFENMGFTRLSAKPKLYSATPVLYHGERPNRMYVDRTFEEGWVVIDPRRKRWKRLGWLDWLGNRSSDVYDTSTQRYRLDFWVSAPHMIVGELDKMLSRDSDWIWGDDGWRYEIPKRMTEEELDRIYPFLRMGMYLERPRSS